MTTGVFQAKDIANHHSSFWQQCLACGLWHQIDEPHSCPYGYGPDAIGQGWACPRCHKVYGPHIDECKYCNDIIDRNGLTTITVE
jgi:hypothetical protein